MLGESGCMYILFPAITEAHGEHVVMNKGCTLCFIYLFSQFWLQAITKTREQEYRAAASFALILYSCVLFSCFFFKALSNEQTNCD